MGPRFLEIELTGRCQLHCRHCYRSSPSPGDLPPEAIRQVIHQAPAYFDALIFSGGEPFLHEHVLDLAECAHERGYSVHITTSGYQLPRETLNKLPGNVVLVFGMDGIGMVHDAYRGKHGAYDDLLRAMVRWGSRPMEIITTLWRGSLGQLEDIARLAADYGAGLHFNTLIPVGRARDAHDILLSAEEHEQVHRLIGELKQRYSFLMSDHYRVTERDQRAGIDLFCKGRFCIDPQGNVHPCEFLRSVTFGNIVQEELSTILTRAGHTRLICCREEGFRRQVRLDLPDPFDYHTSICHPLAAEGRDFAAFHPQ